jgi:hypothetical protein
MKHFNLVFIKHGQSNKQYVFQLPMDVEVSKPMVGKVAICNTRRGEERGVFASENIILHERAAKAICAACGGYFPPAFITGFATEQIKLFCNFPSKMPEVPF